IRQNAFVKLAVAFEDRQGEYFLEREPAGFAYLAWVEDQLAADVLGEPPVEAVTPARRRVFPDLRDRLDDEADLFHRFARDRRRLLLAGLDLAADRPPAAAPRPRRSRDEQRFAVLDDDGDNGVDGHKDSCSVRAARLGVKPGKLRCTL